MATASMSRVAAIHTSPSDDMDLATSLLLAQLALEDFGETKQYTAGRGHTSSALSEAELFNIQSAYMQNALQAIEDAKLARSFDEGVEANHPSLGTAIWDSESDRRAALALLAGDASLSSKARGKMRQDKPEPSSGCVLVISSQLLDIELVRQQCAHSPHKPTAASHKFFRAIVRTSLTSLMLHVTGIHVGVDDFSHNHTALRNV